MPIDASADHVAVAVPSIEAAAARWHDQLGGGWASPRFPLLPDPSEADFGTRQLRFAGGTKLELLEPNAAAGFAATYLERFGPGIHHVTLKVPALLPAIEGVRGAGYDVVDVSTAGDGWHEGFLRPSQVGGLIVQLAWSRLDDAGWAAFAGMTPEEPAQDAARLVGPLLSHPDLDAAARLWSVLGAEVTFDGDDALDVRWGDDQLTVRVVRGERPAPIGLRFSGAPALPADPVAGAAVLPV